MNITLIGMTGAGKTSMGQELAKRLDFRFIDVDELIEKKFNLILQEIVDLYGDQSFIEIEEQAVLDLDPMDRSVISPGGSVIYSAKAMEFLSQNSTVIFLDASFESIRKRIHNQSSRGIIGLKGRKLLDLFEERRPLYQKYAERTIVLRDDLDRDAVVKEILQKLPNEKKEGGNEMTKKQVGYADCIDETLKGFDEDRVLLVSQGKQGPPNVMTIGWGQVGIIWGKPIFTVLVRPSRYTYKLMEESGDFTVNIVPPSLKEVAQYCGTASGRDHDKFKEKGLTAVPSLKVIAPIIKECLLHFECRTVHKNDLNPSALAAPLIPALYPKGDFHRFYFGEILACQREG